MCRICVELNNMNLQGLSIQDEIKRLERAYQVQSCSKLADDPKNNAVTAAKQVKDTLKDPDPYDNMTDEEFDKVWDEYVQQAEAKGKVKQPIGMPGAQGFKILDKPVENKKSKLDGVVPGDDWGAEHTCQEGVYPMKGTNQETWIICKICGKEMRSVK